MSFVSYAHLCTYCYIHAYIVVPVVLCQLWAFTVLWFWLGKRSGRNAERKAWENEVLPVMDRLQTERNTLWRSSVSKTQKLNRLKQRF